MLLARVVLAGMQIPRMCVCCLLGIAAFMSRGMVAGGRPRRVWPLILAARVCGVLRLLGIPVPTRWACGGGAVVSAAQSSLDLVHALARAEWGALAGVEWRAARVILETLARMQWKARADRRGAITTTAQQVANAACYSKRWTSYTLTLLEDAGVIEWHRGGIVEARPTPSVIRIVKTKLVELIRAARARHDEAERRRQTLTRQRLALLRLRNLRPYRRARAAHVEAAATLPPYQGRRGAPSAPEKIIPPKDAPMNFTPVNPRHLPPECTHGKASPALCRDCIDIAVLRQERAIAEHQEEQTRRAQESLTAPSEPTPFERYMRATYPTARPSQWPRLTMSDPTARELSGQTL